MDWILWLSHALALAFVAIPICSAWRDRSEWPGTWRGAMVTLASTFLGVSLAFHVATAADRAATKAQVCALAQVASRQIGESLETVLDDRAGAEDAEARRLVLQDPASALRLLVNDSDLAAVADASTVAALSKLSTRLTWQSPAQRQKDGFASGPTYILPPVAIVEGDLRSAEAFLKKIHATTCDQ